MFELLVQVGYQLRIVHGMPECRAYNQEMMGYCTSLEPPVDISSIEIPAEDIGSDVSYCMLLSFRGIVLSL
jgi:hypothetical protein